MIPYRGRLIFRGLLDADAATFGIATVDSRGWVVRHYQGDFPSIVAAMDHIDEEAEVERREIEQHLGIDRSAL